MTKRKETALDAQTADGQTPDENRAVSGAAAKPEDGTAGVPVQADEVVFGKAQWLESKQYGAVYRDMLEALLEEGRGYTANEVKAVLNQFLEKAVL